MADTSNFDHLSKFDPALAKLGAFAERYFGDDANTALIKTRQFAERLAAAIAERTGLEQDRTVTFVDTIRHIKSDGTAPDNIIDAMHWLRRQGNVAAHDIAGERRDALHAIKLCHRLGVWFHATVGNKPGLRLPFVPPRARDDDLVETQAEITQLNQQLEEQQTERENLIRAAQDAKAALSSAEERARLAEEERDIFEQLAQEAEARPQRSEQVATVKKMFMKAAFEAAKDTDFDETDTRLMVDQQLRHSGWEADSAHLRYSNGTRPEAGRNLAIAEWPTTSGPCDYALFVGRKMVAVIEAKRRRTDVMSALDIQAKRYSEGMQPSEEFDFAGGPWDGHAVPFTFATNGRSYQPKYPIVSGIWYRDTRRPESAGRAIEAWPTPEGLTERLEVDAAVADARLETQPFDFGFSLRPYQKEAIDAVEASLRDGTRQMLIAMATGTGKTKLSIAMIYRLLEAKRFLRVCFVVDRSALGEQAEQAFETTRMVGAKTFAEIFGLRGLADKTIDRDAKVHVCTVQSLVKRVLMTAPDERPPIDQYDLILIDECHRGYLLDREMSDAEMTFRDQDDYVSKYRRVVDYFDAVKIGLTATPALHTTEIFGNPIYRYSYRDAVIDGWLIDHDPPHQITTALSAAGITFDEGETIDVLDPKTGAIDTAQLEDRLDFSVEHFNRKVIAPAFNRAVTEEIARQIDITLPQSGKTLVFAASDRHADDVVMALREAYRAQGVPLHDGMIVKVTGSVDRVSDLIRSYKNDEDPRVAVTVDLLTTGIDVPSITNLVFLRRVNSRILYDQMIGRATRLCEDIGKEVFQIYDAVDLYPNLEAMTEMRPVVVNPAVTFETLFDGLETAEQDEHREEILDQIIVKLARKIRRMNDDLRNQYEAQAGETPEETLQRFRKNSANEVRGWTAERPGLGAFFDFKGDRNAPPIIPISHTPDEVIAVTRGYGEGTRPEDFIDAFASFVRNNRNRIAALQVVLTRPRDLTREALRELRLALDAEQFTEPALRSAWRDQTNEDVAASIVGFIRQAALGDPLVPYEERVNRAVRTVAARHSLTTPQRKWLDQIASEIKSRTVVDRDSLDEPPFSQHGGFRRLDKLFGGELQDLLHEVADETWGPAA